MMAHEPTRPLIVTTTLVFGVYFDPYAKFEIRVSDLKTALGLRPRAREDTRKAEDLARRNWALLELIAREALDSGRVTGRSVKQLQTNYTFDFRTFTELLDKHEAQFQR